MSNKLQSLYPEMRDFSKIHYHENWQATRRSPNPPVDRLIGIEKKNNSDQLGQIKIIVS